MKIIPYISTYDLPDHAINRLNYIDENGARELRKVSYDLAQDGLAGIPIFYSINSDGKTFTINPPPVSEEARLMFNFKPRGK